MALKRLIRFWPMCNVIVFRFPGVIERWQCSIKQLLRRRILFGKHRISSVCSQPDSAILPLTRHFDRRFQRSEVVANGLLRMAISVEEWRSRVDGCQFVSCRMSVTLIQLLRTGPPRSCVAHIAQDLHEIATSGDLRVTMPSPQQPAFSHSWAAGPFRLLTLPLSRNLLHSTAGTTLEEELGPPGIPCAFSQGLFGSAKMR